MNTHDSAWHVIVRCMPPHLATIYVGALVFVAGLLAWFTSPLGQCITEGCIFPYPLYQYGHPLVWVGFVLLLIGLVDMRVRSLIRFLASVALGTLLIVMALPLWFSTYRTASIIGIEAVLDDVGEPLLYIVSGVLAVIAGSQGRISNRLFGISMAALLVLYVLGILSYAWL